MSFLKNNNLIILFVVVFTMLTLYGCSNKSVDNNATASDAVISEETTGNTQDVQSEVEAINTENVGSTIDFNLFDLISTEDLTSQDIEDEAMIPDKYSIDMGLLYQNPELPTGCESVSLTMILNYLGFDVSKTEIANNYLVRSEDNYVIGFVGDPYYSWGRGCYAPGIVDTANVFLDSRNSNLTAFNISGAPLEELFSYVANDIPVLIWTTCGYSTLYSDSNKEGDIIEYNGISYDWTNEEHCVVLSGYDKEGNTVTIYDPIYGVVVMDKDRFDKTYKYMYSMAIVIK